MQLACAAPASLAVARPLASKAAAHRPLRPLLPGALPRRGAVLRVAAIKGEEKEDKGFKASPIVPAFTRRREHAIGRVAALGFAFSIVGELLTGVGPIGQLHFETGIGYGKVALLLAAILGYGAIGGLMSSSPTYDPRNAADIVKRKQPGPLSEPRRWIARNEILVGRLAMVGFLVACVLEFMGGGQAPLVRLGLVQPGTQLADAPWYILAIVGLFAANGLGFFSAFGKEDEETF